MAEKIDYRKYVLGPVKPHVREAAKLLGTRFDIDTIYGWGTRTTPGSDHPLGLALDFMISSSEWGTYMAEYIIQRYKEYRVKYLIWEQRIWQPGGGWTTMEDRGSVTANHFDHIHVSFLSGGKITADPNESGFESTGDGAAIRDAIGGVTGTVNEIKSFFAIFQWLTNEHNLKRIGMFGWGGILIVIALFSWDRVKEVAQQTTRRVVDASKS